MAMLHPKVGHTLAMLAALTLGCATPDSTGPHAAAPGSTAGAPAGHLIAPTPIDLGTLGDPLQQSAATGINDATQVVGWSETPSGVIHGFLWQQPGGMQDLGTPTGQHSFATAINDIGRVVGWASGAAGTQPWVWNSGQYTFLPLPSGYSGKAMAIAPGAAGFIAGCISPIGFPAIGEMITWSPQANPPYRYTRIGSPFNPNADPCSTGVDAGRRVTAALGNVGAAAWRANAWHFLPNPNAPFHGVAVYGLEPNGTGRAVGEDPALEEGTYWPNLDLAPVVFFSPGACVDADHVRGFSVNRTGGVVGSLGCADATPQPLLQGFYWATEGESVLLPPLLPPVAGGSSAAVALNNTDQAVGYSTTTVSPSHATLWGVLPEITVIQLPPCSPRPCRVPPKVSYIPRKFINDGILSRPGFDATLLDPNLVTLGDGLGHVTRIARTATGAPMATIVDVDGDGDLDLSVNFSKAQLIADGVLTPTTRNLGIGAIEPTGLPWTGHYPIWVQ